MNNKIKKILRGFRKLSINPPFPTIMSFMAFCFSLRRIHVVGSMILTATAIFLFVVSSQITDYYDKIEEKGEETREEKGEETREEKGEKLSDKDYITFFLIGNILNIMNFAIFILASIIIWHFQG